MKIVIVVNSAWAAYNFRFNLAQALEKSGYKVIFVIPFDAKYSDKLQKKFQCKDLYLNAKGLSPFQDFKTFLNLVRIFKRVSPDVVCNFSIKPNIYGSIAAKVYNIPCIDNITGLGTVFIERSLSTLIVKCLYRTSLSLCKIVFFQNIQDQDFFKKNKLIKNSKTFLLPGSGVDLDRFKPSRISEKKNKFVFLLISRLIRDKGVYEFIDAIKIIKKSLPDVSLEFQILGEVDVDNRTAIKSSELEKWIEDDLVNYLGVTDTVEKIIPECDCVVLPSYREGMPRSILEAFAIERPVVVSNAPGCIDIVEHQINGLICKVKSSQDLADKMITMVTSSKKVRNKMALNGRNKVEEFYDEKIVINKYVKSINSIVNNEKII